MYYFIFLSKHFYYVIFSETYWSKLPDDCLKNVVDLFKKESAKLIYRIAFEDINWDIPRRLQTFVQILHMVYKVPLLHIIS